jgi:hypothetical protein
VIREGDLYLGKTGGGQREMFPVTETKFILPEAESQITFVKDDKGEVVEMLYDQNGGVIRCKRIKEGVASNVRRSGSLSEIYNRDQPYPRPKRLGAKPV